jgi:hypothetical protein
MFLCYSCDGVLQNSKRKIGSSLQAQNFWAWYWPFLEFAEQYLNDVYTILSLIRIDIKKKLVAMQLEVIYDSQATNRKLGRFPVGAPFPPASLLLVVWESYMSQIRISKN